MQMQRLQTSLCAVLSLAALGCAETQADPGAELGTDPTLEEASATGPLSRSEATRAPALAGGTRTTLVEGIASAENLFITSDARLFVSGDEGVYHVARQADGTMRADNLLPAPDCRFGGITEARGTLFVNCYGPNDSHVYGAKLGPALDLRRIATLKGVSLANGLTADESGHLYVACTGQDKIMRLTLADSDSLAIAKQEVWLAGSGTFTNGIKYASSKLYWTDFTTIKSVVIGSNGQPGRPRDLATRLTFLDDLFVDEQGIVVADWLGGAVRTYGLGGIEKSSTTVAINMPSAVLRAKGRVGFSQDALLITEKGGNRVSVLEPR
jgi:sugar lactone lactonase YvrE